jgi:hypothetical protein
VNRPSRAGLLIALAISIPVLIEARTLVVWLGYDVPLAVYVPLAALLVAAGAAALWVLGEPPGNPRRA